MRDGALGLLVMFISAVIMAVVIGSCCKMAFGADNCTAKFAAGKEVTLTARPCPGSYFVRWDGACAGQGVVCKIKMTGNKQTSAVFDKVPFPQNLRLLDFGGFTVADFMCCQSM